MISRFIALVFTTLSLASFSFSQEESLATPDIDEPSGPKFYVIPVRDAIDKPILYAIRNGVKTAIAQEFDYVVLDMKTPGGRLDVTLEIMEILDRFPGKTITYVNDEATSAGAIIASVTNEIYFSPRGTMGSAEPVTGQGEDINESMKRKITSYLNAKMGVYTAEYPFRSDVIRAMMDPKFEFKIGDDIISPVDELLNLNAIDAHKEYGDPPQPILGSGVVDNLDSLLDSLAVGKAKTVQTFEASWSLELAQFIVAIAPFLFAIGVITVYMEFQIPGFGVFGIIGVICFVVAFFGHNVAGLSGNEPLLFFIVGVALLALEVFVAPGTLLFAIPGVIIMLASILWSMVDIWPENTPDFTWEVDMLLKPLQNLMIGGFLGVVVILILARFMPKSLVWNRLVLNDSIGGTARMSSSELAENATSSSLIGSEAVATTDLVPSGEIEIEGRRYEARLQYGSADRGTTVRVLQKTDFGYIVEEVKS